MSRGRHRTKRAMKHPVRNIVLFSGIFSVFAGVLVFLTAGLPMIGQGSRDAASDTPPPAFPIQVNPFAADAESSDFVLVPPSAVLADRMQEPRQPLNRDRTFTRTVLTEGLVSPDGIAIHPFTGALFVSEEDASRVRVLIDGETQVVIDGNTPVYHRDGDALRRGRALVFPEAIAFSAEGDLYAVEDTPGGRLIRFRLDEAGGYSEGEAVDIPGIWSQYAWEGLDVGSKGELLLAGSDVESVSKQDVLGIFSSVILYRDTEGNWWIPYQRLFSSFSEVRFSKSGKQAVYTCEITGEIGWIDLVGRHTLSGHSSYTARGAEGLTILPDGSFLVAEERGTIVHIDPASDRHEQVVTGLKSIESVQWDAVQRRVLVTEDGSGRLLAFAVDRPYDHTLDMLLYATYYPAHSPQNIPKVCPDYLAQVLAFGGLDYMHGHPRVSFRDFVSRVPIVAADVRAAPLDPDKDIADPVLRVQFVVFEPNRLMAEGENPALAFAVFGLRTRSGRLVKTSRLPVLVRGTRLPDYQLRDLGAGALVVPQPSAVTVSSIGIATVHFLGLGRTPDYSLVLNPRNPLDSYMVVHHDDGTRDHYRLETTRPEGELDWVIAYTHLRHDQWQRLSGAPGEVASEEQVPVAETIHL